MIYAYAILQAPDFGTVIQDVIREKQLNEGLIRGQVELVMDLIDQRPDQLEHSHANVFDLAGFLCRLLRGATKSIRCDRRQFSIKACGLSHIRSSPFNRTQEDAEAPRTDG